MENQPKDRSEMSGQELAGDEQAQLVSEATAWVESKGISRCPVCGKEDAWDLAGAELVNPLAARNSIKISSDPRHQGNVRIRNDSQAGQEWSLRRIRRAVRNNMGAVRLLKLTCGNCRYALLLDHVKISEETAE